MLKRTKKPYWLVAATLLLAPATFDSANAGGYHIFYSFKGGEAGKEPIGPLLIDNSGNLTGTALGTVYQLTPDAEEAILYRFPHGSRQTPRSGVIADNLGNLYGTTANGGTCGVTREGCGIVFKIAPDGTETTLHAFQGGTDGAFPLGGLVMDGTGNLYGTTSGGGENCDYCGTVFKITPDGTETVLHAFQKSADGRRPGAGVILDSSGNLYGTTEASPAYSGYGTVFKLSPDGTETILYSFKGPDSGDGAVPWAPLVMDTAGNLYGTTISGGVGFGTVFKLSPNGKEKVLHAFLGGNDGSAGYDPGLVLDSAGNLYGVRVGGSGTGCYSDGCGIVFKMSPHGKEKILHTFEGGTADGWGPSSPLVFYNGELYGTTRYGGIDFDGTVFRLKP